MQRVVFESASEKPASFMFSLEASMRESIKDRTQKSSPFFISMVSPEILKTIEKLFNF